MPAALLLTLLLQQAGCTADAVSALADAGRRARFLDVTGAVTRLQGTPLACETTRMAFLYLRGLQAAREAYRSGGDGQSLAPVTEAVEELGRYVTTNPRAELMRVTLMAAAAAAQSERDDMSLLLQHATTLETELLAAGTAGAPGVSAHEAAGDLWLQVHRFESARAAYQEASRVSGLSPRIALGLARVAVQLRDEVDACAAYRTLTSQWSSPEIPAEIVEARTFLSARCMAGPPAGR
jgi:hypothetical protein